MNITEIIPCDISKIIEETHIDGKLQVMPYEYYKRYSMNEIRNFMYEKAIYVLPTTELIDWLKNNIIGKAIEIGAGHGAISRALGIPITDSRLQEEDAIKLHYIMNNQPLIQYADDVEKLDAIQAVNKYKPDTVIGGFITHKWNGSNGNYWGVDELLLINSVKKYIHIGNKITHQNSALLQIPHEEYHFDWLITRGVYQEMNRIFVWTK